ncbi:MAG TPA: arsenate reductase ArsC [Candidatus Bathyarchaeia archaeon]|nr:arsenate reductase ArsC [Candidatus Bathyarchaeia archaeon]
MKKQSVLFICIHNSARSQMAEAFLKSFGTAHFTAESAGLEPGKLNPLVVEAMKEMGIDLSGKATQGVADLLKQGKTFDYVITVCDEASAERCPMFPGKSKRLHWGFPDPSRFEGSHQEKLAQTRLVRDQIAAKVKEFCSQP